MSDTATVTGCVTNEWGTFCEYEKHPFLWREGEMTDLGTLGGPHGTARGVNSRGDVVGESSTTEQLYCYVEGGMRRCIYRIHAFVWSDGEMVDLGVPGAFSFATGINDRSDIVGSTSGRPVVWQRD